MKYQSGSQNLLVHDHPTDQRCHWTPIFKSSFVVFRDAQLMQGLMKSQYFDGQWRVDVLDYSGYAEWLCGEDKDKILNLTNVLLFVCEHRGLPTLPVVPKPMSVDIE